MAKELDKALELIQNSHSIAVLTGAGISTATGIPDFRGEKGIYKTGIDPEKILHIDYFLENPKHLVFQR